MGAGVVTGAAVVMTGADDVLVMAAAVDEVVAPGKATRVPPWSWWMTTPTIPAARRATTVEAKRPRRAESFTLNRTIGPRGRRLGDDDRHRCDGEIGAE